MRCAVEPKRQSLVIAALGSAQTISWASSYYIPAVLAAPMAASFSLNPVWVFGAFSIALLVSALVGPWAGARIDRLGGRGVLMISNFVFALARLRSSGLDLQMGSYLGSSTSSSISDRAGVCGTIADRCGQIKTNTTYSANIAIMRVMITTYRFARSANTLGHIPSGRVKTGQDSAAMARHKGLKVAIRKAQGRPHPDHRQIAARNQALKRLGRDRQKYGCFI